MKLKKYFAGIALLFGLFFGQINAAVIGISFPDTTVTVGDTVLVPVYVDSSLTGKNVLSFQIRLSFYDVSMDVIDIETAGALAENFTDIQYNISHLSSSEYLNIAAAGTTPLSGKGSLLFIRMVANTSGYVYLNFADGSSANFFNQGEPAMIQNSTGPIRISALPTINITPDNQTVAVSDMVQYSVYSAISPLTWWVGDPSVATIDTLGKLTAVGPGFTKVYVSDSRGVKDSTTTGIKVEPFHVFTRDTLFYDKQTVMIPVYLRNAMELFDIRSGQFQLSYDNRYFSILDVISSGTVLDGVSLEWNNDESKINIAFASDVSLSGQGILFYIKMLAINPYTSGYIGTYLTLSSINFNEDFSATTDNGYVRVYVVPNLVVTPVTAELNAGQTFQFQATNGFPPLHWSTSDTNRATIDSNGLLTAQSGGVVHVMAVDSLGGSWESGDILIYDMHIYLNDTTAYKGGTVKIPVCQQPYRSGIEVFSFQSGIAIDTSWLKVLDVSAAGGAYDGWELSHHVDGNVLRVAGANATASNGTGIQYFVEFEITGAVPTKKNDIYFTITDYLFNEGLPTASTANARLTLLEPVIQDTVSVSMGSDSIQVDSVFTLPVMVDDVSGKNILSYEFTFNFDTSIVSILGFEKTGTISSAMNIADNASLAGAYTIAAAGTDTITGGGTLLLMKFMAKAVGQTALSWTNFKFNEGDPVALLANGSVVVNERTAIFDGKDNSIPASFVLEQNYPNPFNPSTTIRFQLNKPGSVELQIFNSSGQLIRNLRNQISSAGDFSVLWDGKNDQGISLPSGTYYYRLKTSGKQQVRKMTLIK